MTEGLAFEPEDEIREGLAAAERGETEDLGSFAQYADDPGWLVTDPDGNVVASGGQTVTEASADAGEDPA